MDIRNARTIADAVTAAFRRSIGASDKIKQDNFRGSIYLLLAEDIEDSACALMVVMDREPRYGATLASVIKGLPTWDAADCALMLVGFADVVEGTPAITTADELRTRAAALIRETTAIAEDPQRNAIANEAFDDRS